MKPVLLPFAVSTLLLTGCGTNDQAAPATPSPTIRPTSYYGETASAVAARIPGCGDVKPGDVAQGGPNLASWASCTLSGRRVDVYSWSTPAAEDSVVNLLNANKQELYYAQGTGWTAFVDADATLALQFTNQGGELLKYTFAHQGETPAPKDLPGEKVTAGTIADGLGGVTMHEEVVG
ncbi:hypothetical protein KIH31_08510 [Paenarthrobacter sp. DKR-5]|uniref:hypothetical protein n=1 Tax=Paenarthrobacter sp. DKR-5 TaxID=2835535 RepID=UPI001BDC42DD|nr:hypothetical protein [Paenarthrobacter sp. DKR-5]MBT1002643.1 hypothetical protein [Paenarthrobacter sp. DKR-5]